MLLCARPRALLRGITNYRTHSESMRHNTSEVVWLCPIHLEEGPQYAIFSRGRCHLLPLRSLPHLITMKWDSLVNDSPYAVAPSYQSACLKQLPANPMTTIHEGLFRDKVYPSTELKCSLSRDKQELLENPADPARV